MDTSIAFCVRSDDDTSIQVRVNFGVFAGRNATQAEIDDLAGSLNDVLESFSIIAEERHEFGGAVEASLRQVVIEIERQYAGEDVDLLCDRVVARAEAWAADCIQSRANLGELGSEL